MSGTLKLKTLNLQNFATFEDQVVSFGDRFNAITGETGSGKSLILDALQLVLGQRADKKAIRKDCEFACVEAVFSSRDPEIKEYFLEAGHPFEEEIVIKRIILRSGTSKAFLNYQQCPVSLLASVGKRFIDLVGQFENQKLFSEKYQLALLDNFAGNKSLSAAFSETYHKHAEQLRRLETLKESQNETARRLDYINFQLNELETLGPDEEDELSLRAKKEKCLEIESNKKLLEEINYYFEGGQEQLGLESLMGKLDRALSSSSSLDQNILEKFRSAWEDLREINFLLNKDLDFELSDSELAGVIERLDLYKKAQRKFGTDTAGLVAQKRTFEAEKSKLENLNVNMRELSAEADKTRDELLVVAKKLHDKRREAAERLSRLLTKAVRALKMDGASFQINLSETNLGPSGISKIGLNAEINPGEGFYKVKDIASGGELSRILLALRQVLSSRDSVSIFLFDEIDTGMGGETAYHIGKSLSKVSEHSQVIAITHLPQIASFADKLLEVKKEVKKIKGENRTVSTVNEASDKKSIKERVASMTPLSD